MEQTDKILIEFMSILRRDENIFKSPVMKLEAKGRFLTIPNRAKRKILTPTAEIN